MTAYRNLMAIAVSTAIVVAAACQLTAQQGTGVLPAFELASVRVHPPEELNALNIPRVSMFPGGRLSAVNMPIRRLVTFAYGLQEFELTDRLPEALGKVAFDIIAQAGPDAVAVPRGQIGPMNRMMRALLRDRFKAVVRPEPREETVFVLTRAYPDRLGPGMQRAPAPCAVMDGNGLFLRSKEGKQCWGPVTNGVVQVTGFSMREFARQLETFLEDNVVDRTGLDSVFDFTMPLNLWDLPAIRFANQGLLAKGIQPPAYDGPDLPTALREHLGLRLSRERAMVTRFVLERAEMPTEN